MAKASRKQKLDVAPAKKAPAKKTTTNSRKKVATVSDEVRLQMIAEAAFYNSLKREQVGGDPVEDWLLAEKQIEQQLS